MWRTSINLLSLLTAVISLFWLLSSFEPGVELRWRFGYAVAFVASFAVAILPPVGSASREPFGPAEPSGVSSHLNSGTTM